MTSRKTKLLTAATGLLAVIAVAGCDLQEDADTERGRQLFVEQCGACHTLAEAATTSEVGPDLDASFADARAQGFDGDTIEGVVEDQIANPRFTDPDDPTYMPPEIVTGSDATDVAAYVASVAGVPGIEPPQVPGGPGAQVFANNGCGSCHVLSAIPSAQGQVGPNLDDVLAGQDAAMIEESIVDPAANIAPGFSDGVMPTNYGDSISPEELQELVDFLAESAGGGGGGNGG